MSCSPFDLNDYFLEELAAAESRQVETHVKKCAACREELDRLRIMGAALRSVADEEIPQRIAFVSDKIFEPSPWRRRLAAFWNSGSRLGFLSAAMLSASLLVFAFTRPAPVTIVREVQAPAPASQALNTSAQNVAVTTAEADVQARIQAAVDKAVAARTEDLQKELREAELTLKVAADRYDYAERKAQVQHAAAFVPPPDQDKEDQQ